MKWFKHISDSMDDPFIFGLIEEFGGDGYMVFFGVLEIYSREFSTKDDWILTEKSSFFRHKLLISSSKFKKILSKITKWQVSFSEDTVSIFIPKFKELMDESTLKKLREKEESFRNRSGTLPKTDTTDADADADAEKEILPLPPKSKPVATLPGDFVSFWNCYPKKIGKEGALKKWLTLKKMGKLPSIEKIISEVERQKQSEQWTKDAGQYIPHPATWLNQGRWEDEIKTESESWHDKVRAIK